MYFILFFKSVKNKQISEIIPKKRVRRENIIKRVYNFTIVLKIALTNRNINFLF